MVRSVLFKKWKLSCASALQTSVHISAAARPSVLIRAQASARQVRETNPFIVSTVLDSRDESSLTTCSPRLTTLCPKTELGRRPWDVKKISCEMHATERCDKQNSLRHSCLGVGTASATAGKRRKYPKRIAQNNFPEVTLQSVTFQI